MWDRREEVKSEKFMRSPSSRTSTPDPARPQQLRVLHTGEALATRIRLSRSDRDGYESDGQGRSDTARDGLGSAPSSRFSPGSLSVESLMMSHGYGSRASLLGVHSRSSTPPQSPQVGDRSAMSNPSPLASRTPASMRPTPDSTSHDTPSPGSSLARRGRGTGSALALTMPVETGDAAARVVPMTPMAAAARVRPTNLFVSVGSRPSSAEVDSGGVAGGGGPACSSGLAGGGGLASGSRTAGSSVSAVGIPHGLTILKPAESSRPSYHRHSSSCSSRPSSTASLSRSIAGCALGVSIPSSSRPSSAVSSIASSLSIAPCPSSAGLGTGGFGTGGFGSGGFGSVGHHTSGLNGGGFHSGGFGSGKQMSQRKLLRIYDSVLSEVAPRIFVGADESARDLAKLREAGITHVVNCAAGTCANYFEDTGGGHHHTEGQPSAGACCEDGPPLSYLSLYLQDSLREDISRAFYDSIEFIDDAVQSGGSVLIHCQHGVSRSATIAMAHLMWRDAVGYEEALDRVRSIRPTVNPNIGFACALLAWQGATLAPPAEALAWELCRVTGELRPLSYEPGLGGRELLEAVKKVPAEAAAVGQPHAGGGNENGKEGGHGHADEGSGVHPHPNGVGGNGGCTPEGERLLVFQRGPGAACWVEGGSGGAIAPAAALSEAEARLRRFHRLPPNVKIRVLCAGSEDASFWQLLGGEPCAGGAAGPSRTGTPPRCTRRDPPPGCVPETLGSARSVTSGDDLLRNESGCTAPSAHPSAEALRRVQPPPAHQSPQALRRMQMQAAALQHILVEISLALPTSSSCAGSCAGSPPGSLSSSLPGSLPGSCSGSVRGATPLAARSSDLTPYEMNELLDLPTAPFIGHNTDRVLPSLSQLGKLQDGRLSAIARLSASQDLLAQPVLPEESGEVRAALAWLLEELLPELAGTYLAPLGGELHEFGRGLAPTDGGAHEPAAEVGGIEGEDLLAAEERLVARIHQARDEAEADCEAAFAAAEAAHA